MATLDWHGILGWDDQLLLELRYAGFLYLRQGKYKDSLPFFKSLTNYDPKNAYDMQTLGALYLLMNEKEMALDTFNRALEIDPTNLPTLLNKAKTQLLLGNLNEGLGLARSLLNSADPIIANDASALILAYS